MTESAIDLLQSDFKKLFKPFLRDLQKLRGKYINELGAELFEATIADAAQQLKKEIK